MHQKIPALFLILCSIAAAALLLVLGFAAAPHGGAATGAYTALILDETAPDGETAARLNSVLGRSAAGPVLSAASQWVFLDDFGELRQIPLEQYGERLEPFDPRNDGYAERLRSFFVRDGKRFFYIPRAEDLWGTSGWNLEKKVGAALGDIPYTLVYRGWTRPFTFYLVLFAAAAVMALFLLKPPLLAAVLLPVPIGLSLWGAPALALMALLVFMADLLLEPLRELCFSFGRWVPGMRRGEFRTRLVRNCFTPFRLRWFLAPVMLGLYGVLAGIAGLPLRLAALTALCFGVLFLFYLRMEAKQRLSGVHVRFVPVLILESSGKKMIFPRSMLPFVLASCLAVIFSGYFPASGEFSGEIGEQPPLISAAEYWDHLRYQRSFSFLPLGRNEPPRDGFDESDYFQYDLGEDGLIAGMRPYPEQAEGIVPAFPLEGLMAFLGGPDMAGPEFADAGSAANAGVFPGLPPGFSLFDLMPVLLVLLLSIPAIAGLGRGSRKKKKMPMYNEKRIAA
jgi:sorbitol-specific phosphotransferase system component IIC